MIRSARRALILAFILTPAAAAGTKDPSPPAATEAAIGSAGTESTPTGDGTDGGTPLWERSFENESRLWFGPEDGLRFEDASGTPRLHLGGAGALQFIKYDPRNTRHSGARVDRAILRIDGTPLESLDLRLSFDLKGTDTHGLEEGWLSYEVDPRLRFTTGLIRVGLGHEFHQEPEDLTFVGWAFPTYLDARSDAGARLDGEFRDGTLYYDLVATAGSGYDPFGQTRRGSQFSARVVTYPFRGLGPELQLSSYRLPVLSGLFAGAAVAYSPHYRGHLDIATPLRSKIFLTPSLSADSSLFLHYTAGGDFGPFRVTYELVNGSLIDLDTPAGEESLRRQITSWAATVSWMLTGEHYDSRPYRTRNGGARVRPRRGLWGDGEQHGLGAWELAGRFSNADIDRDFFNFGVADFAESSQEFRTFAVVLNWYATRHFKTSFEVTRTIADQDPAGFGGGGRDTSYVMQLQYWF